MNTVPMQPGSNMHDGWRRFIHWSPRILGILFVLFISLFALDVFGMEYGIWDTLVALAMHLIPSFVLLAVLALAWRWPWVGALAFCGFGAWYVVVSWQQMDWATVLLIAGIPFAVGLLFLGDWWVRRRSA